MANIAQTAKKNTILKKGLALFLCIIMCISPLTAGAFAEEEDRAPELETPAEKTGETEILQEEILPVLAVGTEGGNTPPVKSGEAPLSATAANGEIASGECGENLTWSLDETGTLTISGTGAITDYTPPHTPWYNYHSKIKTVVINSGVTSIGRGAFLICPNLTRITISDSVASIDSFAFPKPYSSGGSTFSSIFVSENNNFFSSIDGILYNKDQTKLINYPNGRNTPSFSIPDSVTSIGDYSFDDCVWLMNVIIPDSVISIGTSSFSGCTDLVTITIPANVTSIGEGAFAECSKLSSINVSDNNACYISIDGVLFNKEQTELIAYPCGRTNSSYSIPNGVIGIGDGAFYQCSSLTDVTIPDSVTNIGDSAFGGCSGLTSITIPNSVTNIGSGAFAITGLKSVVLPNGITKIETGVLSYCYELTNVTIPASVTSIGEFAFSMCGNLENVYYTGTEEQWNVLKANIETTENYSLLNANVIYNYIPVSSAILTDKGRSLSLLENIRINQFAEIESETLTVAYIKTNGGLLAWSTEPAEGEATYENAVETKNGYRVEGLKYTDGNYYQQTEGIIPRHYGDLCYLRIYLRLPDGSYLYTPLKEYSVNTYCNNRIEKSTDPHMKALAQAVLDYGAAAKNYMDAKVAA